MKKIFLDCGTNLCQGLQEISKKHNITDEWEVYSFEANPLTYSIINKNKFSNVKFINKAVWNENCTKNLTVEIWPGEVKKSDIYNIKDDIVTDLPIGGGCNIMDENFIFIHSKEENITKKAHIVECFDFSNFILNNFKKEDFIIIKLDIEGAEYPVLEKMIKDDTLKYVDILYVEWHNHMLINKYDEISIINAIKKENINLNIWF
jgi:FkbM family methyltransferase